MFRRVLTYAGLIAGLTLLGANVGMAQRGGGGSQCIPADTNSMALVSWVRKVITGGTSVSLDNVRNTLGLSAIDTTSVSLVTSSKTCASAAAAIDQLAHVSASGRLVYVVQAGRQRYVVQDPNDHTGEWHRTWVFDSHFNVLGALGK